MEANLLHSVYTPGTNAGAKHGGKTMSADEQGYNGWSNYETWAVKLWLDNDEGSYIYWTDVASEVIKEEDNCDEGAFASRLSDQVRNEEEDRCPIDGMAADLLGAAFDSVNWYEIAEAFIAEAKENAEYDA